MCFRNKKRDCRCSMKVHSFNEEFFRALNCCRIICCNCCCCPHKKRRNPCCFAGNAQDGLRFEQDEIFDTFGEEDFVEDFNYDSCRCRW